MRVLCITSSWPRDAEDIAGCFVKRWAQELIKAGAHVEVLCWDSAEPRAHTDLHSRGLDVRWVRYAPKSKQTLFYGAGAPEALEARPSARWLVPGALCAMILATLEAARRQRPDVIVGHWLVPSGLIARLVGQLLGIPSVIVTHSGGVHLLGALPRVISRPLAWWAARGPISFVSEPMLKRFERLAFAPYATILPMGFDAPAVAPSSPAAIRRWVILGRLVPIKRVAQLIEAFLEAELGERVQLHVIGDGPQREYCERLSARSRGRVVLHGVLVGAARDAVLAGAEVALFGSGVMANGRQEGLPVSLLECMSAGLAPVVAQLEGAVSLLVAPELQQLGELEGWPMQLRAVADAASLESIRRRSAARVAELEWSQLGPLWAQWIIEASQVAL